MILRFLILCNKNGVKTEPMLQYVDEIGHWRYVETKLIKSWENDTNLYELEENNE